MFMPFLVTINNCRVKHDKVRSVARSRCAVGHHAHDQEHPHFMAL